ncbi:MAG: hypothetical protein INR73_14150 [Williamsia sp.]|nr:hypothetical protein [Williamsia sp.]
MKDLASDYATSFYALQVTYLWDYSSITSNQLKNATVTLTLPPLMREVFAAILPKPKGYEFEPLPDATGTNIHFFTAEADILRELPLIISYYMQANLKFSIKNDARNLMSNQSVRKEVTSVIKFLDPSFAKGDTAVISFTKALGSHFQYFVSDQLQRGDAKIFYKRSGTFVDTIFHRFERYGEHGDRFYYLPGKRSFFS